MNSVKLFSVIALAAALAAGALSTGAQAAVITKNSGATTPDASDFSPTFNGKPHQAGYHSGTIDSMFRETFRTACGKGQHVSAAQFRIKVQKLSQGPNAGDNDALSFWDNGQAQFTTYLWQATDTPGTVKTLAYNLATALPPVNTATGVITNTTGGNGLGLLGDGDFSFSVQDDTSVLEAGIEYGCAADAGPVKKGLTWGMYPADTVTGTTTVSCQATPGAACDPYNGDTPGTAALPVLCFRPMNLPYPVPNTGASSNASYWSGGVVATTPAVSPISKGWTTRSQVSAYCASEFGPGWVVAEHHMGGNQGWKFGAYGNVGQPGVSRFWVDVNDQANGNVWH